MSRFRTVTAGFALAVAATLLLAAPAAAHDELVDADPRAGQDYDTAPTSISLTFSGDVMTVGALVVVVDEQGKDWVSGEPEIIAGTVVVPLGEGMPTAGYEVRWRVVSSDGHPISGLVPFTVGGAAPLERTDASVDAPAVPETTAPETTAPASAGSAATTPDATGVDVTAQTEDPSESASLLRIALLGGGGALLALALWAGLAFLRRRRSAARKTSTDNSDRKAQS